MRSRLPSSQRDISPWPLTNPPRRSTGPSPAAALQQRLGNRGLSSLLKQDRRGLHPELLRALAALDLPGGSPQAEDDPSVGLDLLYTPEAYNSVGAVTHVVGLLQGAIPDLELPGWPEGLVERVREKRRR